MQRKALPLRKGMHHLRVAADCRNVKLDRALHTV